MSVSFPQMAFWVIFPLAALIVVSGWVMIIISAVKKLRAGKRQAENESASRSSNENPVPLQPNWTPSDGIAPGGTPAIPLP
jgi:L-asparagine transporter-like permease